jgi:hypothetical protein
MTLRHALALAVLAACSVRGAGGAPRLTDLDGSLEPLAGWFAEHAGTPRAILLLSPV